MRFLVGILIFAQIFGVFSQNPCIPKQFNDSSSDSVVCVCNSTYCDEFPPLGQLAQNQVAVYTTSIVGKRFERTNLNFQTNNSAETIKLIVNTTKTFQQIIGFGGAASDTASINLFNVTEKTRQNIVNAYFGPAGIGYTTIRVPMAATDFSIREYSYDDVNGNVSRGAEDFNLTYFSLQDEDLKYKIPFIKMARDLVGSNLKLFSSPWGPPAWMKTNGLMHGNGMLKEIVGGRYYQTWANYFLKFFEEYNKQNVTFWATTVQNEPDLSINLKYPQLYYDGGLERDFIKLNLGPTLKNSPITKDIKIMMMDTNRYMLPEFPNTILTDPVAASYVSGIGVHWYADGNSGPSMTNGHGNQNASLLTQTHDSFPDKFLLYTEACNGWNGYGYWGYAENYAHDIIENLNNWVSGWTDWNMMVNETGGPSWVGTQLDAPIVVQSGADEFYKQPIYYAIGHFSKLLIENSTRVQLSIDGLTNQSIEATAFLTPSNQHVVIIQNRDNTTDIQLQIFEAENAENSLAVKIEKKSFITLVWNGTGPVLGQSTPTPNSGVNKFIGHEYILVVAICLVWLYFK